MCALPISIIVHTRRFTGSWTLKFVISNLLFLSVMAGFEA